MIFDTHAHYDDEAFNEDREAILNGMEENGVSHIVNIGANIETSKNTIELTHKYPFIYGAIGVHPDEVAELNEEKIQWLKQQARNEKIVAIGEMGLDYYWNKSEKDVQQKWFLRQLELAQEVKLPVIIHSRDAAKDTIDILKGNQGDINGGVIHCYSYSKEVARDYLNMDYYFGIGGVVTFKNAKHIKEVVEYLPLDKIVLETDCPYLAPMPFRGKRNTSSYLKLVAEMIGEIKGLSYQQVIEQTNKNGKALYQIK